VCLRPGHKKEIKITFRPEEAKVVVTTAVFTFKESGSEEDRFH
jgi:hypothetical protein